MKTRKIKIPQYLVRGKHRDFHVLVFPKLEHAWAYYEFDYQRYEIDGGYETYLWLKYAMAALIASPDRILYFPIRKPFDQHAFPSHDAVFTRPELQFRHSEWVNLRHQLDKAHQVRNYCLLYNQEKLRGFVNGFLKTDQYYRAQKRLKQEVNMLLGDTIFLTMIRENCFLTHADICNALELDDIDELGFPVGGFHNDVIGFFLPQKAVRLMVENQKEFLAKKQQNPTGKP